MRISHKYKFVFIAVPRTGSTSFRAALDEVSEIHSVLKYNVDNDNPFYNHISAEEIKAVFLERGWNWDEYTKFCVVRNPYDRAVSLYHHRVDTGQRTAPGKSFAYNFIRKLKYLHGRKISFADWLRNDDITTGLSRSVKAFTHDHNGVCLVDKFIRFENMDEEFLAVAESIGFKEIADKIEKKNSTKDRAAYREYYNDELSEIITKRYEYEIKTFGYQF